MDHSYWWGTCITLQLSHKNIPATMSPKDSFAFLLLLLLLSTNACKDKAPQPSEKVDHYENGVVSRKTSMLGEKKEGKMTDYYNTGKVMAERWFVNDQQQGKTQIYYESGKLKEVQYYKDGERQGGDSIWYENGKLQFTVSFDKNLKHGDLYKWSPEGTLIFNSRYQHDTLVAVKGDMVTPKITIGQMQDK